MQQSSPKPPAKKSGYGSRPANPGLFTIKDIVRRGQNRFSWHGTYGAVRAIAERGGLSNGDIQRDEAHPKKRLLIGKRLADEMVKSGKREGHLIPPRYQGIVMVDEERNGKRVRTPFWRLDRIEAESGGKAKYSTMWSAIKDGRLHKGVMQRQGRSESPPIIRESIARQIVKTAKAGGRYIPNEDKGIIMRRKPGIIGGSPTPFWTLGRIESMSGGKIKRGTMLRAIREGRFTQGVMQDLEHSQHRTLVEERAAKSLIKGFIRTGRLMFPAERERVIPIRKKVNGNMSVVNMLTLNEIVARGRGKIKYDALKTAVRKAEQKGGLPEGAMMQEPGAVKKSRLVREDFANEIIARARRGEPLIPKIDTGVVHLEVQSGGKTERVPFWSIKKCAEESGGLIKESSLLRAIGSGFFADGQVKRDPGTAARRHLIDAGAMQMLIARARAGEKVFTRPDEGIIRIGGNGRSTAYWSTSRIHQQSGGRVTEARINESLREGLLRHSQRGIVRQDPNWKKKRTLVRADVAGAWVRDSRHYTIPVRRGRGRVAGVDGNTKKIAGVEYARGDIVTMRQVGEIEEQMEKMAHKQRRAVQETDDIGQLSASSPQKIAAYAMTERMVKLAEKRDDLLRRRGIGAE